MRRGRKRKDDVSIMPPARERNGQQVRISAVEQIAKAELDRQQKEMATVLSQPHRHGNSSQLAESVLGRFCEARKLRRELYDSALEYAGMKRRWISYWGGKLPEHIPGNGFAHTLDEDAQRWLQRIEDMEYAMSIAGGDWRAVCDMAVYDMQPSRFVMDTIIVKALLALAVECGRLDPKASPR